MNLAIYFRNAREDQTRLFARHKKLLNTRQTMTVKYYHGVVELYPAFLAQRSIDWSFIIDLLLTHSMRNICAYTFNFQERKK